VPVIAVSNTAFTVTILVAATLPQLFVTVYDIVTVPAAIPVTSPELFTVATSEFDEDHVPPAVVLLNVMVAPAFTEEAPDIVPASGRANTVTTRVAATVPHPLVTV
jgi:hypothetical protein